MVHCHEHSSELITFGILENFDGLAVILTLFITGLIGSFTHCIGMCGPIAASRMSIRLIGMPDSKVSQKDKLKCALTIPYYIGKAFSYNVIAVIPYFLAKHVREISWFRWIIFSIMITTAILFFRAAFLRTFNFKNFVGFAFIERLQHLQKSIIKYAPRNYDLQKSTYGIRGIFQGMVLGFIPCGLVYGAVVTAITYSDNIFILLCSVTAFAMATIPGLFISSYFGSIILVKFKNMFHVFYSLIMILNSILLIRYALKLI
jgi:uncharacterized protein